MKQFRPSLLLALTIVVTSMSCQFLSNLTGQTDPQPPFNYVDDRVLKFVPETLPNAHQGTAYEARIDIENVSTFVSQISISQNKLPDGLALERIKSENAVKIVGTPLKKGTYTFKMEVQCFGTNNPGQVGEKEYTIVVE